MNSFSDIQKEIESSPSSISLEDFFEAYYQCRRRKRNTINAYEFELDYESKVVQLWKDVNTSTYEMGTSIAFLVEKPKLREVFAADFRDRIVHHIIMMRLEPLFEQDFIVDNYNCRIGKGNLFGIMSMKKQIKECSENYTKDCYVGKFDMQGFFMSIKKSTLYSMLEEYILERYDKPDRDTLLYLVKKVVMACPQYNCVRKTPIEKWDRLPANKSLFTCGDDYGLPIGNLTSQCFANFYLHYFDLRMKEKFTYYGRYVDDFFVVSKNKKAISNDIPCMSALLLANLHVKLHPKKVYIQHYKKGVKFIGAVVKGNRTYISNTTVGNMYNALHRYNKNYMICPKHAEKFVQSLNSYWGIMCHHNTANVRKKLYNMIDRRWFKYIHYDTNRKAFVVNRALMPCKYVLDDFAKGEGNAIHFKRFGGKPYEGKVKKAWKRSRKKKEQKGGLK